MIHLLLSAQLAAANVPPPIVNGTTTAEFFQVGAIMGYSDQYGGFSFCSGTLVHEKWVVTAAHCVEAVQDYDRYGLTIYFVLGESIYSEEGIVEFDTVIGSEMHPDYRGSNSGLSADIGVMELESGLEGADPIYLFEEAPGETWEGLTLDYVGWGITDDGREDSGIKRTTQIPYWDHDAQFIYAYDPQTNLCSGDSGGASLRYVERGDPEWLDEWEHYEHDSRYVLVGVNSFVFAQSGGPCDGGASGATRIDAHLDWLREYIPPLPIPEPPPEPEVLDEDESLFAKMGCSKVVTQSLSPVSATLLALLSMVALLRRRH